MRLPLPAALLPALLVALPAHAAPRSEPPPAPPPETGLHLGPLEADREIPRQRVTSLVAQKLRQLERAGAFQDLPSTLLLELVVDGSGAVVGATLDPPGGTPGRLLVAQLLGWRLPTWVLQGLTRLRLSIRLGP